jgi:hypothetical protein
VPRDKSAGDQRGWGLHFTNLLASAWGKDSEHGSRVWFELRVP